MHFFQHEKWLNWRYFGARGRFLDYWTRLVRQRCYWEHSNRFHAWIDYRNSSQVSWFGCENAQLWIWFMLRNGFLLRWSSGDANRRHIKQGSYCSKRQNWKVIMAGETSQARYLQQTFRTGLPNTQGDCFCRPVVKQTGPPSEFRVTDYPAISEFWSIVENWACFFLRRIIQQLFWRFYPRWIHNFHCRIEYKQICRFSLEKCKITTCCTQ